MTGIYVSKEDQDRALSLLQRLVSIQSGTPNLAGIGQVQQVLKNVLESLGFSCSLTEVAPGGYGPHLIAKRSRPGCPRILLSGHVDTVFPPDSSPTMTIIEDRALGQGVVDMKGGIVCGLAALGILEREGCLDSLDITVLHESDEEVGNPSSRPLIAKLAPNADLVLVFEEAGKDHEIVIGRRGIVVIGVTSQGVAGHAGNVSGNRRNAIEELASKITQLRDIAYGLADRGILFNVGTISGGTVHNVIAERASCEINLRFSDEEGLQLLQAAFDRAVAIPTIPGTNTTIDWECGARSPAMPTTKRNQVAAESFIQSCALLGHSVMTQVRGGTSAANLWAEAGAAVIDGLGPVGGDDHSDREWMSIPSLFIRIEQVAFFLKQIGSRAIALSN